MSKYGEVMALLEWATKTKEKKAKTARKPKPAPMELDNLDIAEVYLKLQAREKKIKQSMEAIEKMMKKEEKKDDRTFIIRNAFWLIASFPIIAPLYVMWLVKTLKATGMF